MPVPSQDLDFLRHMLCFFLCSASSVKMRGDFSFVDIGGIDYHHRLNFLFIIVRSSYL